ncbi:MAG: hypothetical protein JRI23_27120 [Deltaproteobacteria bacterium]|jgi:hypothetical protein|nr:hypothetical protein [Deltaproteobacteria bacterium]MBW2535754.1 hypothetical protein [Deltaproteobacteria bacterium]
MGERDIRDKLRRICTDLDRFAGRNGPAGRASAVLAPLVVGAGIALVACGGDVETEDGDGGSGATATATGTGQGGYYPPPYGVGGWGGSQSDYGVGGVMPPYGVAGWGGAQSDYGVGGYAPPPYGVGGWGGSQSDYGVGGAGGS